MNSCSLVPSQHPREPEVRASRGDDEERAGGGRQHVALGPEDEQLQRLRSLQQREWALGSWAGAS